MRSKFLLSVAMAMLAVACAGPRSLPKNEAGARLGAMQVIEQAAAAAPAAVAVSIELTVKAVGQRDGLIYLNSEDDYRDQRNISVDLLPSALPGLRAQFGENLETALKGRRLLAAGPAERVTIWFFNGGTKTDKYYYQTHIAVSSADQLNALDGPVVN